MIRAIAVFLLFVFSLPALAAAPAIDQAGADALKPRVEAALDGMTASLKNTGATLKREGQLMVEPAGSYYAITTPSLSVVKPDGNTRVIGMVAINAIPTSDPDIFKVAIALPTPMIETDGADKTIGNLSIGQQAMNGLWHMKAMAFTELNGSYKNVVITDNVKNSETTFADVTTTMKLSAKDNLWSGPSETVMSRVGYKDPASVYTIGVLHIKSNVDQMDLIANHQLATAAQSAGTPEDARTAFIANLSRIANGADSTITADSITYKTTGTDGRVQSGTVRAAALQASANNLKAANNALTTLNLSVDGVTNDDPAMARLAPSHALLKLIARNLPLEKLLKAADKNARKVALAQAKTNFEIQELTIDAPVYGLDAKGALQASALAPTGYTGTLNMQVRGVDELMALLSNPQAAGAPSANIVPQQIVAALAMIQMTGKPSTDASGRSLRGYDLVMHENGKVILNGADVSALAQAFKPAVPVK